MDESEIDEYLRRRALGDLVRQLREVAGLSQSGLVKLSGIPQGAISQIENGERTITPKVARALDDALDAHGSLVISARDAVWGTVAPGTEALSYAILGGLASGDRPEVGSTRRREFFGVSGGLTAGAVVGPHLLDNALERGSVSQGRLEWIESETQQIARSVFRVPDQRPLLAPAMEQYTTIASLLNEPQRSADRRRLCRAAANICGSLATISQDAMDDPHGARVWFRTARAAALEAGDPYLVDMILVSSAYPDLYAGNPRLVLSLAGPRLEAKVRPNRALAKMNGIAARAHAMLGDRSESRRYIAAAEETLDRSPEPDIQAWASFSPAQLAFNAANAAVTLGDTNRAIEAADRAIAKFDADSIEYSTTDQYNVRFDKAIALCKAQEVAEACRAATDVITDPDMPVKNLGIRGNAARFDSQLGKATISPIADWRDAYHDRLPNSTT